MDMVDKEIEALYLEGEQYLAVGRLGCVNLVNEQLAARGCKPIIVPDVERGETRESKKAPQRRKAVKPNRSNGRA
jgi:hypothetical protein